MSLDLSPAPGAAPLAEQVRAQASMEVRLLLRNGEQLVLAIVIPVLVLVGGVIGADRDRHRPRAPAGRRADARRAGAGHHVDVVHVGGDRDRVRAAVRRAEAARRDAVAAARAARRQGARAAGGRGAAAPGAVAGRRSRWGGHRRRGWSARSGSCSRGCWARRRSSRSGCCWRVRCAPRRRWPPPTSSTCCCSPAEPWCCRARRTARSATFAQWLPSGALGDAMRAAFIDGSIAWASLLCLLGVGRRRRVPRRRGRSSGSDLRLGAVAAAAGLGDAGGQHGAGRHRWRGPADRLGPRLPDLAAVHGRFVHAARRAVACTRRSSSATGS